MAICGSWLKLLMLCRILPIERPSYHNGPAHGEGYSLGREGVLTFSVNKVTLDRKQENSNGEKVGNLLLVQIVRLQVVNIRRQYVWNED
jgi:hypothetical protein